jgi:recombination protein RecT
MTEPAAVQKKSELPALVKHQLKSMMEHLGVLLPPDITLEQFRAALWLELSGRPALFDCTHESLRDCTLRAASHGLLPGRDCHFLPFRNKRKGGARDATFVPNYQGIILALERSGKVRRAFAHAVHEGDEWGFDLFADRPIHKPAVTLGKKPGKELFYYGAIMFKDGTCAFEPMTLEELEAIQKRSPAHEEGPWVTDRAMMRRKTALKRVAKYIRLTPELRQMLEDDEARERDDIPDARHRQNIVDLFGDDTSGYAYTREASSEAPETGKKTRTPSPESPDPQKTQDANAGHPGEKLSRSQNDIAFETLEAHRDDARLPEDLLERINAALSPLAPARASEAHCLAGEVLDYLAGQET